jgi:hypothetical protein
LDGRNKTAINGPVPAGRYGWWGKVNGCPETGGFFNLANAPQSSKAGRIELQKD